MENYLVVLTTVPTLQEGESLAEMLLGKKLAACVNIGAEMVSLYHWEGKLCKEKEWQLVIKTSESQYPALERAILEAHSYTTPEIIALPVQAGSKEYLQWVSSSLQEEE